MSKIIRIKPHNPKRGFLKKSFTYQGNVFRAEAGWYEVSDTMAAYLANARQDDTNEESPKVFDIFDSKEEAKEYEQNEKRKAAKRAEADDAIRVTTVASPGKVRRVAAPSGTMTTEDLAKNKAPEQEGEAEDLDSEDLAADVARDAHKSGEKAVVDGADEDELDDEEAPESVPSEPAVPGAPKRAAKKAARKGGHG